MSDMPPLPERFDVVLRGNSGVHVWCADDMHAYARAYAEQANTTFMACGKLLQTATERANSAEQETAALRAALQELVELKSTKERAEACWPGDEDAARLLREYSQRKDAAWDAARAALEQKP